MRGVSRVQSQAWCSYIGISHFIRCERSLLLRLNKKPSANSSLPYAASRRSFSSSIHPRDSSIAREEFIESYKSSFSFPKATHQIQELAQVDPASSNEVFLHGYLGTRADLSKNFYFVPLLSKELTHSVQIISSAKLANGEVKAAHAKLKQYGPQTPVVVRGRLKAREPSKKDLGDVEKIKNVEVELLDVYPLNDFPDDIIITEETRFPPEQRHLQLRNDKSVRDALAFRSKAASICRDQLAAHNGFLEIETPLLFKSTPEGAREFLVPTRTRGMSYALPQSPQQYKQILMGSGIARYFQIAKCFRDEDLRADRQPEFTQLDLEMSFATGEDVMQCIEGLVRRLWSELLHHDIPGAIPRMTYENAMSRYGSDKPDLRFGSEIAPIGHLLPVDLISKIGPLSDPTVEVFKVALSDGPNATRKFVAEFMDSPAAKAFVENPEGQPGIFIYDSRKPLQGLQPFGFEAAERLEDMLELEDGDLVVLQARKKAPFAGGSTPIGNLRLALHRAAVSAGILPEPTGFQFLWITDFPLFSPTNETDPGQGGTAGICSTHHPFTAPKTVEDVDLLPIDPLKAKGEHYDLVVNGVELGGGSKRVHSAKMQEYIMRDILKMSNERIEDFRHLLEVLRAGCPPHAGIALGFDRLIAVMLGKESVRDVIAFPKSGKGEDMLVKSPTAMTKEQLETYHLQLRA